MVWNLIRQFSVAAILGLVGTAKSVGQTPPCPRPLVDTSRWREVVATIAALTFRLPEDLPEHHYRFQTTFAMPGAPKPPLPKRQFFFSQEHVGGPHIDIGIEPRPAPGSRLSVFAADSTVCSEIIDGHSATVIMYRSKPEQGVTYNIWAQVDFTTDSVLALRSMAENKNGQAQALAVLRSIRFH